MSAVKMPTTLHTLLFYNSANFWPKYVFSLTINISCQISVGEAANPLIHNSAFANDGKPTSAHY